MKKIKLSFKKPIPQIKILENTEINGIYIGKKDTIFRSNFNIIQSLPKCSSNIHIKAVLYDNAILELNPTLIINKGALFTNSYLKIEVLLIGSQAKATVVPTLEIMEDQIKAGHAAVIGKLDKEQLFYLMSRGLSLKNAQEVLINAFININE